VVIEFWRKTASHVVLLLRLTIFLSGLDNPQNCPSRGGSPLQSSTWFLGPTKVSPQTTCQSFQPFLQCTFVWPSHWQTDRHTDHVELIVSVSGQLTEEVRFKPNAYSSYISRNFTPYSLWTVGEWALTKLGVNARDLKKLVVCWKNAE